MKCAKCKSEKIQAVSETIQLKEKSGIGFFVFLYAISITALIVAFGFLIGGMQKPRSMPINEIFEMMVAIEITKYALPTLFITMLAYRITPFKLETKTKIICLDCGNTWYLEDNVAQETEEKQDKESDIVSMH